MGKIWENNTIVVLGKQKPSSHCTFIQANNETCTTLDGSVALNCKNITFWSVKILGPVPTQAHWAQVQSRQGRVQILVKMWK